MLIRKRNKKNKYQLNIYQTLENLKINGKFLKKHYEVVELWLFDRNEDNNMIKIKSQKPSNIFSFNIPFSLIKTKISNINTYENEGQYDWFFKVRINEMFLDEKDNNRFKMNYKVKDGVKFGEFFVRCGRFSKTNYINNISQNNAFAPLDFMNYITTKGNLSLICNGEPNSPTKIQIDKIKIKKDQLKISGKIFTRNSKIDHAELVLKHRETNNERYSSVKVIRNQKYSNKKYGLHAYKYETVINLKDVNVNNVIEEGILDVYILLTLNDMKEKKLVRVGRPTNRARLFLKEFDFISKDTAVIANPYFTFKLSNLSLEIYHFPTSSYRYLKNMLRFSSVICFFNRKKKVWLVGERTYKAQDTGFAFFKYLRKEKPKLNAYYVIDKNSPEYENVRPLGNVIEYKSKEHIFNTIIASKVISSHHPDYLYPVRTPKLKSKVKADKFFLQHGVMGTKNMVANYGKKAYGFDTDFFLVSSDFEREMIINDFEYNPDEVFVTGLSRFDSLFNENSILKNQIAIIPTWRDWLSTIDVFEESEYFKRYKELLNSPKLLSLANEGNFEIIFCLHPNMQQFSSFFESKRVKVVTQGEISVQTLLKESKLLITDYSSVGFDFSFLEKPVIYYQFDRDRFIGRRPSHLDLDNDLPGPIYFDLDPLLESLQSYVQNDFKMLPEYRKRKNKFIKYTDKNSCKRIFEVIKNNAAHRKAMDNPKIKLLKKALYNKFRKSKFYYPTMKKFYSLGRRIIPIDKKLIVFESGIGRQFGDSPKNIYDEIINKNLDYKFVWVLNKNFRVWNEKTKVVKRLSPSYYYYLLRARYWVNNQNFPTYIKKRKETTYLQTWHGTPLKKMLFDIENVQGRADDYVERVASAVSNWDYLISPSTYATNAFKSAFHYKGSVLEVGYPRNDIFYSENITEIVSKTKRRLNIPENKKVILYAPTFRDNQTSSKNKFLFDVKLDFKRMQQRLGNDYVLLIRMHVVINNKIKIDEDLEDFVINVSNYPDMQELLLLSDVLITDYSSVMFDYANTLKPILFFTYDLEEYRDSTRGFYMNFEDEAPGPFLKDTEGVIDSLMNIEAVNEKYKLKYNDFYSKYCYMDDGSASKRVVSKVFE